MDSVCADHYFTCIGYGSDHDGYGSDHDGYGSDHYGYGFDHYGYGSDHDGSSSDHGTSGSDHTYVTFSHADNPSSASPLQREADRQHRPARLHRSGRH